MDEFSAPTEEILESTFGSRRRAITPVDREAERRLTQPIEAEIAAKAASRRANIRRHTRVAIRENSEKPAPHLDRVAAHSPPSATTPPGSSQSPSESDVISRGEEDPFGDIPSIHGSLVPTPRGSANSAMSAPALSASEQPFSARSPPPAPLPSKPAPIPERHAQIIFPDQQSSSSNSHSSILDLATPL